MIYSRSFLSKLHCKNCNIWDRKKYNITGEGETNWFLLPFLKEDEMKKWILVLAMAVFIIAGCASTPIVKIDTVEVSNFVTFRSDPIGAEILVVDATTGKEVGAFGKTPVRIMLFKNSIETNLTTKESSSKNLVSSAQGFVYGGKKPEGVEYQFKFRMAGFYDELKVMRFPLSSSVGADVFVNVKLELKK